MKKLLFLLIITSNIVLGQTNDSYIATVKEGVVLHDKGDYEGAIKKYDEVLKKDPNNFLALAEKAYSALMLKEYETTISICKKIIKIHSATENLDNIYVTYGNAYDMKKEPQESLKVYDEGIKVYPDYYHLYYNKAITLIGLKEHNEALKNLEMSAKLNPYHASTHNAIARMERMNKNIIPSVLSMSMFFVAEPQGSRALQNIEFYYNTMNSGVEKTGRNSITINVDSKTLDDIEENSVKENDFSSAELIFMLSAALNNEKEIKKLGKASSLQIRLESLFSSLSETKKENYGFYWEYYVPFFLEMKEKKHLGTFCYILHASENDKKINKWLKNNNDEVKAFYKWSDTYWEYQ